MFNIFLERLVTDALEEHHGTVSIGGRIITNLRFADDIDGLAGEEQKKKKKKKNYSLVNRLDKTSSRYGMKISAEKTNFMTNSIRPIEKKITVGGQELENVNQFKYIGAIVSEEGTKTEVLARAAQTAAALAKLKPMWRDKNISLSTKLKLLHALVLSIFLYARETWTLTTELHRKIQAVELRCLRRVLVIPYTEYMTNEAVRAAITKHLKLYES